VKVVCSNRKAKKNYHIVERMEAGVSLLGTEVKSLRDGTAHLQDAYASVENGELFMYNSHISPYKEGNRFNHDPKRVRKLLMHKREIERLFGKIQQKGFTLIPLSFYFNDDGKVKVELGLGKGKRAYDKRREIAERDANREMRREFKDRQRKL